MCDIRLARIVHYVPHQEVNGYLTLSIPHILTLFGILVDVIDDCLEKGDVVYRIYSNVVKRIAWKFKCLMD